MKKIMFNDKFGLTKAVIEGRKTQTRRKCREQVWGHSDIISARNGIFHFEIPKYKIGEIIAVAQSYRDCGGINKDGRPNWDVIAEAKGAYHSGWSNKMFVAARDMPHQIRITDVRVERLQDISDEDCLKEGVVVNEPKIKGGINMYYPCEYLRSCAKEVGWGRVFHTPREAFAHLINKVSRKDVWNENPYVFVYDFELVK